MVGEACLPSNAYYPRTPDYTLCSGVHVCWSEHSDSSFVYGFMILNYGFGTMTATTYIYSDCVMASVQVLQDISSLFFKHPSNIFISGPSGSGKTEFVKKMIEYREDLFDILPLHIVWCYKEWQSA